MERVGCDGVTESWVWLGAAEGQVWWGATESWCDGEILRAGVMGRFWELVWWNAGFAWELDVMESYLELGLMGDEELGVI